MTNERRTTLIVMEPDGAIFTVFVAFKVHTVTISGFLLVYRSVFSSNR